MNYTDIGSVVCGCIEIACNLTISVQQSVDLDGLCERFKSMPCVRLNPRKRFDDLLLVI